MLCGRSSVLRRFWLHRWLRVGAFGTLRMSCAGPSKPGISAEQARLREDGGAGSLMETSSGHTVGRVGVGQETNPKPR